MLTTVERCPCSWCLCSPSPGRCPCISVRRGRTCPAPDVHTTATPAASLWEPALCRRDCSSCTDTDLYMKGRQEVVCWWVRMNRYFCGWVSKIVFIPLEAKAVLLCVQCVHWVFCLFSEFNHSVILNNKLTNKDLSWSKMVFFFFFFVN